MDTTPIVKQICQRYVERANSLNVKRKQRDNDALEYIIGAHSAAELTGNTELAEHLGRFAMMLVSVRGYMAVAEMAIRKEEGEGKSVRVGGITISEV